MKIHRPELTDKEVNDLIFCVDWTRTNPKGFQFKDRRRTQRLAKLYGRLIKLAPKWRNEE